MKNAPPSCGVTEGHFINCMRCSRQSGVIVAKRFDIMNNHVIVY
ncbi:hypothetical protein WSI_02055 [Candidatus Liberibacter asiaticus str. gxpsy]|uniref:Uncharacterized protein n=2 Tax=Liberibacter asiaticus TaxID=34021 RepID=C6XH48_LIBAP|nr:hypothetical protein CLIBASIA_03362 [Candidatus Liberibacter asiaticus str. psy62]AGH16781.1 hypothetical protein WSI_02055 [Candidatus Liberibacter asiaticus str. gxpsy]BAP26301.1 hypothetical protein CGUJ_03362 [Candidatus Liberibacter asiaticus str. Ishi-1]